MHKHNFMKKVALLLLCTWTSTAMALCPVKRDSIQHAKTTPASLYPFVYKDKVHAHYTRDISKTEALSTALLIQFVYIGGYVSTQWQNIQDNGSFDNWKRNFTRLHFDKDSYDYNIITHIGNAHYSYLFYRAMGYKKMNAFAMTALGSTIFEFFIETVTEPPSMQDLWQTPVLGSLLGITNERLSLFLVNSDYRPLQFVGYLLNPFLLFDSAHYQLTAAPILSGEHARVGLTIKF